MWVWSVCCYVSLIFLLVRRFFCLLMRQFFCLLVRDLVNLLLRKFGPSVVLWVWSACWYASLTSLLVRQFSLYVGAWVWADCWCISLVRLLVHEFGPYVSEQECMFLLLVREIGQTVGARVGQSLSVAVWLVYCYVDLICLKAHQFVLARIYVSETIYFSVQWGIHNFLRWLCR